MKKYLLILIGLIMVYGVNAYFYDYTNPEVGSDGLVNNSLWNQSDGSYQFNGVNSSINTDYATYIENGTMTLYINRPNSVGASFYMIRGTGVRPGFGASGNIHLCSVYNGTSYFTANGVPYANNRWYFLACTWEKNKNVSLYYDGTLVANVTLNGAVQVFSASYRIGSTVAGLSPTNGTIDEVRIYNKALNASDIAIINASGRNKNDSLNLSGALVYYDSFTDGGSLQIVNENMLSMKNITETYNYTQKVIKNNAIYDVYADILTGSGTIFNESNSYIRLASNDNYFAYMDIRTKNLYMDNVTIYSWNGSDYYANYSKIHINGRSYVYLASTIPYIINSNFSYLGSADRADIGWWELRYTGFLCEQCSNSYYYNNTFSFNQYGAYFYMSNETSFIYNTIYNITGTNGNASGVGIGVRDSKNSNISNNLIYNIIKPAGWLFDDSAGVISTLSNNTRVYNNTIFNAETGIAYWLNNNNGNIMNNSIYNILGSGIKVEHNNDKINVSYNYIHDGGTTGGVSVREGIEFETVAHDGTITNSIINNNTIYNFPIGMNIQEVSNVSIIGNNILNRTNYWNCTSSECAVIILYNVTNITIKNNNIGNISNNYSTYLISTNSNNINYYEESYNKINRTFKLIGSYRSLNNLFFYPINGLNYVLSKITKDYNTTYMPLTSDGLRLTSSMSSIYQFNHSINSSTILSSIFKLNTTITNSYFTMAITPNQSVTIR